MAATHGEEVGIQQHGPTILWWIEYYFIIWLYAIWEPELKLLSMADTRESALAGRHSRAALAATEESTD
jgi:hypothetical protein